MGARAQVSTEPKSKPGMFPSLTHNTICKNLYKAGQTLWPPILTHDLFKLTLVFMKTIMFNVVIRYPKRDFIANKINKIRFMNSLEIRSILTERRNSKKPFL